MGCGSFAAGSTLSARSFGSGDTSIVTVLDGARNFLARRCRTNAPPTRTTRATAPVTMPAILPPSSPSDVMAALVSVTPVAAPSESGGGGEGDGGGGAGAGETSSGFIGDDGG